jgi:predicted metal-dependent hydrolase
LNNGLWSTEREKVSNKKIVAMEIHGRTVEITIQRHHWSRQLRLSIRGGAVYLSVPLRTPWTFAEAFLVKSRPWIEQHVGTTIQPNRRPPTRREREAARRLVKMKLNQWSMYFAVSWEGVRIGNQKSRWGSCSSTGTLSFNWRLIELPGELADYIVVHELAHLLQPNHSPKFWAEVERVLPDWRSRRKALRTLSTNGLQEG